MLFAYVWYTRLILYMLFDRKFFKKTNTIRKTEIQKEKNGLLAWQ